MREFLMSPGHRSGGHGWVEETSVPSCRKFCVRLLVFLELIHRLIQPGPGLGDGGQ